MSPDKIIEKISLFCKDQRDIISAFLFGSYATERERPCSDIDIALLLEDNKKGCFPYLDFKIALERSLKANVDLIILNQADETLKYQVRRYGKIIYDADPRLRKKWEILSRKLFQDFLYLHQIYMSKLRKYYGVEDGK